MKIVALTTSYPLSRDDDSSVFVHRLYQSLVAAGHSVTVLAPANTKNTPVETRDGVRIIRFSFLPWGNSRLMYRAGVIQNLSRSPWLAIEIPFFLGKLALLAIKEGRDADVLHANWIPTSFAAALAKLFHRKQFVVTVRGSDARLLKHTVSRWLSYLALFPAARITTVSSALAGELSGHFPALQSKIQMIHNGVELPDNPDARAMLPVLPARFLLAIGSVIPRKNIEALLELLNQPELSNFALAVCGKTEDEPYFAQLRSRIERQGLGARVCFLGSIAPDLIPALLERAAAFVTTSVYEGRPNALLEALFCGKIVFASNIAAHREIISEGKNGFLIECGNPSEAAKRIALVLRNSELTAHISKSGKTSVEGHSWKRCAENYGNLFDLAKSGDEPK